MSNYRDFVHGPVPQAPVVSSPSLFVAYLTHLSTYMWIQGNPRACYAMRRNKGVQFYRRTHTIAIIIWAIALGIYCANR